MVVSVAISLGAVTSIVVIFVLAPMVNCIGLIIAMIITVVITDICSVCALNTLCISVGLQIIVSNVTYNMFNVLYFYNIQ